MFVRRAADLGALVRDSRKTSGLTQGELAERLGTSQRWISELERGKPTVELEMALRALAALGISLGVSEEPEANKTAAPSKKTAASRPRINVNDLVDD